MKTTQNLEEFIKEVHKCETQNELDKVHQEYCLLVSQKPELISIIYEKRCKIIDLNIIKTKNKKS